MPVSRCLLTPLVLLIGLGPFAGPVPGEEKSELISPALGEAIGAAISNGAEWIIQHQNPNGSFPGEHTSVHPLGESALACLALAASGMEPERNALGKGLTSLYTRYSAIERQGGLRLRTYDVALTTLALVEANRRKSTSRSRGFSATAETTVNLRTRDREWLDRMKKWFLRNQSSTKGTWRYPRPRQETDLSNTQFALLALRAARQAGSEVRSAVFFDALQNLLAWQETEGPEELRYSRADTEPRYSAEIVPSSTTDRARGFGYQQGDPAMGSMTAAGVVCLAVCRGQLPGRHPGYDQAMTLRTEQALRDGVAWLARHFSMETTPDPANIIPAEQREMFHYYYLYTLERACGVSRTELVGAHDWYREGATQLLKRQSANGAWNRTAPDGSTEPSLVHTCFAMLFLTRLSDPETRMVTPAGPMRLSVAVDLDDAAFRSLFAAALRRYQRGGEAILPVREFGKMGPRLFPCLLDAMESKDVRERKAAFEILSTLRGRTLGYVPEDPEKDRNRALRRWKQTLRTGRR